MNSMKISEFKENPTFAYYKKCEMYSMLYSIKTGSKIQLYFSYINSKFEFGACLIVTNGCVILLMLIIKNGQTH